MKVIKPLQEENILSTKEIEDTFANIPILFVEHQKMLKAMDQLYQEPNKEDHVEAMSDIFLRNLRFFPEYGVFINKFATILLAIDDFRKQRLNFDGLLKNVEEELKKEKLNLEVLLQMPLSRLSRYLSLLSAIKCHTPISHPSHSLLSVVTLGLTEVIAELKMSINVAEHERIKKMMDVFGSIEGGEGLMKKDRKYLYEGTLELVKQSHTNSTEKKITKKKNRTPYFFLFNDIFLYCTIKKKIDPSVMSKKILSCA